MTIYTWEGSMRDGVKYIPPLETFEGRRGQGMCLRLAQFLRDKNRRVICDLDPTKKHKHFDEKEFFKELERVEGR